jgi:hypothetical protein
MEAIAVATYNFFNAVVLKATISAAAPYGNAALAYSVGQTAAKIAVATATFAVSTATSAIIANQNKPEEQGGLIRLAISPNEPRRLIIGKRQTGGVLSDWMIKGSRNQYLAMVVYLGEGPCGSLKKIYGGGRVVYDADISGAFVHGVRKVIPNFRSGGDRLWITYYDGRPGQTADPYLIAQYPGEWTTNHKGTGCAYAIVEAWWDSDNQTSVPSISFEMEGAKLYDRRKDSTAGGSGAHRLNDPATWEYSTNPAVALDHYLLGRFIGSIRTFGLGLSSTDVPYAEFAALANLCDELVPLKISPNTQKRYEANGFMFADRSFKDTIKDLCRAMNSRPADKGGRIGIIDGQPKTPVLTLTNLDLVDGAPDLYRPKQSWGELVSGANGTYIDARQNYQPVDFPRITNPVWDAQDNGQPKFETIDFEMEVSQERAERLALLFVKTKRRQARLTGTYKFRAIQLEQGDWFIRSGGKFGAGKTFEVMDRILNPSTMSVTIAAVEVDPADSAWVAADARDIVSVPTSTVPNLPVVGVPSITITPVSFAAGGLTFPAFRFDNPDASALVPYGVNIEYAFSDGAGTPGPTGERFSHVMPPGQAQSTVYGLIPNRAYVVRAQSFYGAIQSAWTSWLAVSTSATYSSGPASSITGQGALATLNFTQLGSTVRLADGVTVATNALLLTSAGTAAAIAGQGFGATANQFTVDNQYPLLRLSDGLLRNSAFAEPFTGTAQAPGWTSWVGGAGTFAATPGAGMSGNGLTVTAGAGVDFGSSQVVPAAAGITYLIEAEAIRVSGTYAATGVYLVFRNSGGTELATHIVNFATAANTSGVVSSSPDGLARWERIVTAPTGTTQILMYRMDHWSGIGSIAAANTIHWRKCDVRPLTLVSQLGANVTGLNTAAAITGQGALATLGAVNTAQIVSGAVSGVSAIYIPTTGSSTLTVTTTGGPLLIAFSLTGQVQSDNTLSGISVQLQRGGTNVYGPIQFTEGFGGVAGAFAAQIVDQPAAGTYTYTLSAGQNGMDISYFEVKNRAISITELKR